MTENEIVTLIEKSRTEMLNLINAEYDHLKAMVLTKETDASEPEQFSIDIPLNSNGSVFKGRKPISVLFEDGEECMASTWKQVVKTLLERCYATPKTRERLNSMCGLISGKSRLLFCRDATAMGSPIKVGDDMYIETKFDAETLMNVVVRRVLIPAGFDVSGIAIKVQFRLP